VCVLPRGAAPEELFEIADLALEVRTDQPVRFRAYSSSRHGRSRAGDILAWREGDFHALPPLQTIVRTAEPSHPGTSGTVPVRLVARINALRLLQISCVSVDPASQQVWPLEFNIHDQGSAGVPGGGPASEAAIQIDPNATAGALEMARQQIGTVFAPAGKTDKVTAGTTLKSLERILGSPRGGWNGPLLRALWPALHDRLDGRRLSVDLEEAWLIVAGFLLRPGFGVVRDDLRIDALWRLHDAGPCFPGRRIKCQEVPSDPRPERHSLLARLPVVNFRRNQLDLRSPATISAVAVEGDLDQTNKTKAKRHPKQGRTGKAAKPVKARDEAQKPIDPGRLDRAIQYLRNERQR
jgi:hypothetical protein